MLPHANEPAALFSRYEGLDALAELALDMRWSWNHSTDEIWRRLDPELWAITHNPWVILQTVSHSALEHALADTSFRAMADGWTRRGGAQWNPPPGFSKFIRKAR